jgi:hypothetical protein
LRAILQVNEGQAQAPGTETRLAQSDTGLGSENVCRPPRVASAMVAAALRRPLQTRRTFASARPHAGLTWAAEVPRVRPQSFRCVHRVQQLENQAADLDLASGLVDDLTLLAGPSADAES